MGYGAIITNIQDHEEAVLAIKNRNRLPLRLGIGGILTMLALVAIGGAAHAASVNGTTTISCTASSYEHVDDVYHASTSAMTFWADDANPASTTYVTAQSSSGNWLPTKSVAEGSYAAWSAVLPSTYDFYAKRTTQANCNGALPGDGNYTLKYTIVY